MGLRPFAAATARMAVGSPIEAARSRYDHVLPAGISTQGAPDASLERRAARLRSNCVERGSFAGEVAIHRGDGLGAGAWLQPHGAESSDEVLLFVGPVVLEAEGAQRTAPRGDVDRAQR